MPENSKHRGDTTESKIIHELIADGHSVSVPFGDNEKYDLIADIEQNLYRIQCKTAWQNKQETIRFNTHTQTTDQGTYSEETYHGEIDAFVVRYPETEQLYWVDVSDATGQKMEFRFESEIDHPSINWAEEYEFHENSPCG